MKSCADCGLEQGHGVVMLVQSITVGTKVIAWRVCSRCFLKRGAQDRIVTEAVR